jgi:hypothetical protein
MKIGPLALEKMKYMVFSGGGMKALLGFTGSLISLEKVLKSENINTSLFDKFQGFAGSSMGSIISLMLVLGYQAMEIQDIIKDVKVGELISTLSVARLYSQMGLSSASPVADQIVKALTQKNFSANITLKQLFQATGKSLVMTVTHLNANPVPMTLFVSHETYPDLPVVEAIMMSTALPLVFVPRVGIPAMNLGEKALFVDGGLLCDFPFHVFPAELTLGFLMQTENFSEIDLSASHFSYLHSLIQAPLFDIHKRYIELYVPEKCKSQIILVPHKNVDVMSLNLNVEQMLSLISTISEEVTFKLKVRIMMLKYISLFSNHFFQTFGTLSLPSLPPLLQENSPPSFPNDKFSFPKDFLKK